ncbi:putative ABC transporter ATP-binding protein YbhF [Clostridium homopropionicum DSM 5847]|uniref:Putative ABC transporter ATP-binding protein YbhF n=1 Tax=Clostridium homopropionicum DSM 5847 TaxID=1121318 RepID=A0A0L6Z734_9CLOT|nr:ABC transporter ATP-binding protein [Clostridium homopropionicum]KOA18638.1 putative ABC transporter ATP-binding protein YbhF [Clostridium homopropionicum DSM 5847]SFG50948.1 ABC-2 type transport system ATP-binding protein [Clostridium homopropionicum]
MNIIEIKNLTKTYGKNRGIDNVNLTINEGEIFGFIGPNGAGKSTTIKTLLNLIFPTSGEAKIFGLDCVTETTKIKENIGYVPSEVRYYDDMTIKEIIDYAKSFKKNIDEEYVDRLIKLFDMELSKKIYQLSLGNKKKVSIIQALIHKPKLLILDEPTSGLDPLVQKHLFNELTALNKQGSTIFLSSHNLTEIEEFCHRVAIIREGKIIEIKKLDDFAHRTLRKVSITVDKDIAKEIKSLGGLIVGHEENTIIFNYDKDINELISLISKYTISNLIIEERRLSEEFMTYYEMEEK